MSLQSYREWKSSQINEGPFDVAGNVSQGRNALKAMNPKITAFASNLANVLAQLPPGYAKRLISNMMSKMDEPNPVLKQKLLQTVRYLPDPEPEQQQQQPQQNV